MPTNDSIEILFPIGVENALADVPAPEGYDVEVHRAAPNFDTRFTAAFLPILVKVVIKSGLLPWAASKAYGALWEYLKKGFGRMTPGSKQAAAIVISHSTDDMLAQVIIPAIGSESLQEAQIELEQRTLKNGETHTRIFITILPPAEKDPAD